MVVSFACGTIFRVKSSINYDDGSKQPPAKLLCVDCWLTKTAQYCAFMYSSRDQQHTYSRHTINSLAQLVCAMLTNTAACCNIQGMCNDDMIDSLH